eukprot:TRINITY_DN4043_c0_g1_i1.p1 TRINITY_DN4043_c0_g1~~TRINITY_DN4043_c0_g1_i1.p1  ORF type:complete len:321 (-),score=65.53 TRINITY_DN4043_c0_g1_i1:97-1020(-)
MMSTTQSVLLLVVCITFFDVVLSGFDKRVSVSQSSIQTRCGLSLSGNLNAGAKVYLSGFSASYNRFLSQVNTWRFNNSDPINDGQFCDIFRNWFYWVNDLFTNAACDSGNGYWCNAIWASAGVRKKVAAGVSYSQCTPFWCKNNGGKECKYNSQAGSNFVGKCKTGIACVIHCLKLTSSRPQYVGVYAGKIRELWGRAINAHSKRDLEMMNAQADEVVEEESISSSGSKLQRIEKVLGRYFKSKRNSERSDNLLDQLKKRLSLRSTSKRSLPGFSCGVSLVCGACGSSSWGSWCKDEDVNCCFCEGW